MNIALKSSVATGWMQTFTGRAFYPANPDPEQICITDIAHSLSRQCRYAGHCIRFYSVGEHCCLMSDHATPENKLTALMHDASEAYLIDIPRPVKPLLPGYYELESKLMAMIADKYGFAWPLPAEVKHLDTAIISDEREQNLLPMDVDDGIWGNVHAPLMIPLQFWSPDQAYFEFTMRFSLLCG